MRLNPSCIPCLVQKQQKRVAHENTEKQLHYLKDVLGVIANSQEQASAPYLTSAINRVYQNYFGKQDDYAELKQQYNAYLLERMEQIQDKINHAADPLLAGIQYARAGNYIDFGAMNQVNTEDLDHLLETALEQTIDPKTYQQFCEHLDSAKKLVYLTDNCGEIVLDLLLLQQLKKYYLDITIIVRGAPILNDATLRDAKQCKMDQQFRVLENGTDIAGTELNLISDEAKQAIQQADIIISKGQGNFESLHGCGLNIYYLFLCKCQLFVNRFHLNHLDGVFINERDVQI